MAQWDFVDANTLGAGGSVTAPGALAAFATCPLPPAGIYIVEFTWFLSGTTETQLQNVSIALNGTNQVINTLPSITGAAPQKLWIRYRLNGTNAPSLKATSAATAGAVYSGIVTAQQIG